VELGDVLRRRLFLGKEEHGFVELGQESNGVGFETRSQFGIIG
jgi:hypothetical protein